MLTDPPTATKPLSLPTWLLLLIGVCLSVLSMWTWQKWDATWVEPSEAFFPPEWQNEDLDTLAWTYPIYRSNDTYQWVHLADSLAAGNHIPLQHRFDEGPVDGRPNRWHSGLAHLLRISGTLTAAIKEWPTQKGIHHCAHWLGSVLHLVTLLIGMLLINALRGRTAALLFAGLFFFNAAISWDFAYSRLDHESLFQCFFVLHLCGLVGLSMNKSSASATPWAILAGLAAGFCWWISATVMVALSALITIGLATYSFSLRRVSSESRKTLRHALTIWCTTAVCCIFFLCLLEARLRFEPSIASLHPIFIAVQIGSAALCIAPLLNRPTQRLAMTAGSLVFGLSPIAWILYFREQAHPWLDPMMRRLHDHIVEFQSPFSNGLWLHAETVQATLLALLAGAYLIHGRHKISYLWLALLPGLLLLSALQTRWLGLLATVAACALCLSITRRKQILHYLCFGLITLTAFTWIHKWQKIENDPGVTFITDMMLQVGARDINLNLKRLANGETVHVAMPYTFAATSALFPTVHPIGTFYWENRVGIEQTAAFFTGQDTEATIDFVVAQGGLQGAPFATLINWVARADETPQTIDQSLVWKFSAQRNAPFGWIETSFKSTFPIERFAVRIFTATE